MTALAYLLSQAAHVLLAPLFSLSILLSGHLSVVVTPPPLPQPATMMATSTTVTVATTTAQKISKTVVKKATALKTLALQSPALQSPPPPVSIPQTKTPDEINTDTRAALVNVLCTTKNGGYFDPISGSGAFITTNGVVLTNAHVGQYFLLENYPTPGNVSCILRTGSPATPTYTAELLYISPTWIANNADQITAMHGIGTGEYDYAFLLVTGTTDGSSLPSSFPAVPMTLDEPSQGDAAYLAAYPAGFLDGQTIESNLYITSAYTTISALYTYTNQNHVDLVSLGGTVVSQAGSSGGSVIRPQDGALEAIIATATEGTTTADRDLRAITLAHIDRSLQAEGQGGISDLLTGDLQTKAGLFASTSAPTLIKELTDVLNKE